MLIFNIIRDWFVMNVWGGYTADNTYYRIPLGKVSSINNANFWNIDFNNIQAVLVTHDNRGEVINGYMGLGDWLSTTSTIIVLIAVCVALYFLVRYFFRMFAGLISGR